MPPTRLPHPVGQDQLPGELIASRKSALWGDGHSWREQIEPCCLPYVLTSPPSPTTASKFEWLLPLRLVSRSKISRCPAYWQGEMFKLFFFGKPNDGRYILPGSHQNFYLVTVHVDLSHDFVHFLLGIEVERDDA